jgi:hypothetical protein
MDYRDCMQCGESLSPKIYHMNNGICSKCLDENEENDPYLNIDQAIKYEQESRKEQEMDKKGIVGSAYYKPSESMEYIDAQGNFYNRSFQRLRNPKEYEPDEDGCYTPFGDE